MLRIRQQYNDRRSHVFCSWTSSADVVVAAAGTGELPRNMHFRVFVVCSVKLRETIMLLGRCYIPYYMQFAAHLSLKQIFHAILNEKSGAFSIANTPNAFDGICMRRVGIKNNELCLVQMNREPKLYAKHEEYGHVTFI